MMLELPALETLPLPVARSETELAALGAAVEKAVFGALAVPAHLVAPHPYAAPSISATDGELLEAYRAGDRDAADELVRRHRGKLISFMARRLGPEAAEDAVQEIFLRVLGSDARIDNFSGYLMTTAFRFSVDASRRARRFPEPVSFEDLGVLDGIPFDPPDPYARVEPAEVPERADVDTEALMAAVESLPAKLRDVFLAVTVRDRDYQAAADEAGIPIGTVKSRVNRARGIILRKLGRG